MEGKRRAEWIQRRAHNKTVFYFITSFGLFLAYAFQWISTSWHSNSIIYTNPAVMAPCLPRFLPPCRPNRTLTVQQARQTRVNDTRAEWKELPARTSHTAPTTLYASLALWSKSNFPNRMIYLRFPSFTVVCCLNFVGGVKNFLKLWYLTKIWVYHKVIV